MFMFQASTLLAEMERLAPDVLSAVQAAMKTRTTDLDFLRLGAAAFEAAPDISIDYAIVEKTDKGGGGAAPPGWVGVGLRAALADIAPRDDAGNSALGDVL